MISNRSRPEAFFCITIPKKITNDVNTYSIKNITWRNRRQEWKTPSVEPWLPSINSFQRFTCLISVPKELLLLFSLPVLPSKLAPLSVRNVLRTESMSVCLGLCHLTSDTEPIICVYCSRPPCNSSRLVSKPRTIRTELRKCLLSPQCRRIRMIPQTALYSKESNWAGRL